MTKPETRRNHAKFAVALLAASVFPASTLPPYTATEPRFDVILPDATEGRATAHEVAAAHVVWLRSATDLRTRLTTAIDGKPA